MWEQDLSSLQYPSPSLVYNIMIDQKAQYHRMHRQDFGNTQEAYDALTRAMEEWNAIPQE